jgi:amino acid transporter
MTSKVKLNELQATAICGNDISSSCLYVSALSIIAAGSYAWIALLIVGAVLFLFRKIYGEVVGALPLNGGAYNALLNTTSKFIASMAACLTLLSYMATAVISASEAMHYLQHLIESLPVIISTIILLLVFMALTIYGIGESAIVAVIIFIFHISSLFLLVTVSAVYLLQNGVDVFSLNQAATNARDVSWSTALMLGFAAAMLGISGFESSANFVEEQDTGVFPKTLKNMWAIVTFFNPLIALLVLAILPIQEVADNSTALLSHLGVQTGGNWLGVLISIDAVMVLSGAVLTSYVGVSGLVERMALDRIMPQFFLKKSKRQVSYRIMIGFFILCASILLVTEGEIKALAGLYTIAFLAVMALFGIGNLLLKYRRGRLPRPVKASVISVIIAVTAVIIALYTTIETSPAYVKVFVQYFLPTALVVLVMLNRTQLLLLLLSITQYFYKPIKNTVYKFNQWINTMINNIDSQEFVFFTKGDNVAVLNKVLRYVSDNEESRTLKIVNIINDTNARSPKLQVDLEVLDRAYPEIDIEFIEINGKFGPKIIQKLSQDWKIPTNFMFIGAPSDRFPYQVAELGGVRLII